MIHPRGLDDETLQRVRALVAATYGGRDDLYAAADVLSDDDLSAICRRLGDDLAGDTAYLEQIVVMHGQEPGFQESVAAALAEALVRVLRGRRGDEEVLSAAEEGQSRLRHRYDETIAATGDSEMRAILDQQKKNVEFAERVLRQAAQAAQSRREA